METNPTPLVVQPKVVDIHYERREKLSFPNVVICTLNPNLEKYLEISDLYGNSGLLNAMFIQMAVNDLYETVRILAKKNLTQVEITYPKLQEQYEEHRKLVDPPYLEILRFFPTMRECLEDYYNPEYWAAGTGDLFDYELFYQTFAPTLTQIIKQCRWNGIENCRKSDLWKLTRTRNFYCQEFTPPDAKITEANEQLSLIVDFEIDEGLGFKDVGGGAALQVYFYDPSRTVLDTWDKSNSLEIAPGLSYDVKLSQREYYDLSSVGDECIEEGKEGQVVVIFALTWVQKICWICCRSPSKQ